MKGIIKTIFFLIAILFLAACSRKKNTFLSRSKHSITTEYNILYNGNIAFEEGKLQLASSYRDNFWEILPVERLELEESSLLSGESKMKILIKLKKKLQKEFKNMPFF